MRTRFVLGLLVSVAFLLTSTARGQSTASSACGGSHPANTKPPANAKPSANTKAPAPSSSSGGSTSSSDSNSSSGAPPCCFGIYDPEAAERAEREAAEARRADRAAEAWSRVEEMVDKDRALAAQPDQYDVIQDYKGDMNQLADDLVASDSDPTRDQSSSPLPNSDQSIFPAPAEQPTSANPQCVSIWVFTCSDDNDDESAAPPSAEQPKWQRLYQTVTDTASQAWSQLDKKRLAGKLEDKALEKLFATADPNHVVTAANPIKNPDEASPEDILRTPPDLLIQGLTTVTRDLLRTSEVAAEQTSTLGSYLRDMAVGVAVNSAAAFLESKQTEAFCGNADTPEGGLCGVGVASWQVNQGFVHYHLNLSGKFMNYWDRMIGAETDQDQQ
jgi:hypothetical protein